MNRKGLKRTRYGTLRVNKCPVKGDHISHTKKQKGRGNGHKRPTEYHRRVVEDWSW